MSARELVALRALPGWERLRGDPKEGWQRSATRDVDYAGTSFESAVVDEPDPEMNEPKRQKLSSNHGIQPDSLKTKAANTSIEIASNPKTESRGPRKRACAKCRARRIRCNHDDDGNLDPVKVAASKRQQVPKKKSQASATDSKGQMTRGGSNTEPHRNNRNLLLTPESIASEICVSTKPPPPKEYTARVDSGGTIHYSTVTASNPLPTPETSPMKERTSTVPLPLGYYASSPILSRLQASVDDADLTNFNANGALRMPSEFTKSAHAETQPDISRDEVSGASLQADHAVFLQNNVDIPPRLDTDVISVETGRLSSLLTIPQTPNAEGQLSTATDVDSHIITEETQDGTDGAQAFGLPGLPQTPQQQQQQQDQQASEHRRTRSGRGIKLPGKAEESAKTIAWFLEEDRDASNESIGHNISQTPGNEEPIRFSLASTKADDETSRKRAAVRNSLGVTPPHPQCKSSHVVTSPSSNKRRRLSSQRPNSADFVNSDSELSDPPESLFYPEERRPAVKRSLGRLKGGRTQKNLRNGNTTPPTAFRPPHIGAQATQLSYAVPDAIVNAGLDPGLNPKLVQLAHALYHGARAARETPREEKPAPIGRPPVWADERQELCETLPYFRSYQGGCYANAPYVFGFMFDACAEDHDYTDSSIVIARAGGGRSENPETGEVEIVKDQTTAPQVESLKNNIANHNPVVIIAGARNPTMRCNVPHTYNVLGWWKPTHIWHEKSPKSKWPAVRYRFEKLKPDTESWWEPQGHPDDVGLGQLDPPFSQRCIFCGEESQQIYIQGWMCLISSCSAFWKLGNKEPVFEHLRYDPRFLKQKTIWPYTCEPSHLVPRLMKEGQDDLLGHGFSRMAAMGAVCRLCGRCNSRIYFDKWACLTPGCGWTYPTPKDRGLQKIIPASSLVDFYRPTAVGFPANGDVVKSPVVSNAFFCHNYRIQLYTIPGCGYIAHLMPNEMVIRASVGPNEIFEQLQQEDLGLERRVLKNSMVKGSRMSSFTVNFGMPYKFVAATASRSFASAPEGIKMAKRRMIWASKFLINDILAKEMANREHGKSPEYETFNELLALAYMEEQSINYHDDGEKGLGPTIATESYGAPGTMCVRMKVKHFLGVSKGGKLLDYEPMPGCKRYKRRKEMWDELQAMRSAGRSNETGAKMKEYAAELSNRQAGNAAEKKVKEKTKADDILKMHLGHGDIVIMHGEGIQEYYEHSVSHTGKLRFALTCRHVRPGHLLEHEKPVYGEEMDTEEYDGAALQSPV